MGLTPSLPRTGTTHQLDRRRLPQPRRLRDATQGAGSGTRRDHLDDEGLPDCGVEAAQASHRTQVVLRSAGRWQASLPGGQRRRERARSLQRHPADAGQPQALIEGIAITCYAIRSNHAFIYIRGEVPQVIRRVEAAVRQAYEAGFLGQNILGSGFDCDVVVHAGAGLSVVRRRRCWTAWRAAVGSPAEAAVPCGCRPVRFADGRQQRRDHLQRSLHHRQRLGLVPPVRDREVSRLQVVRGERATSPTRASTRPRWGSPCANCWSTPAECATVTT